MSLFLAAFQMQAAAGNSNLPAVSLLCVALTIGLLFYTFRVPGEVIEGEEKTRLAFLRERKEAVYENLRDLNFEYKAGKFPEEDYQQMRNSLEEEAAALLAEIERLESGEAEQAIPAAQAKRPSSEHLSPKGVR